MIDQLTPRQIRALDALNRQLVRKVSTLIDELSQGARDAGISPDYAPDLVTCGLEVALDYAQRLRYQLDRHVEQLTLQARLGGEPLALRDHAEVFYHPKTHRVTVGRPDRDRVDQTYTPTPASRARVRRLMNAYHWAHRGTTPRGWDGVTTLG